MYATAKNFNRLGQVCRLVKRDQRLLVAANVFDILEGNGLALSAFACKFVERGNVSLFRVCEADYEEEVRVEVAVVKGSDCLAGIGMLAQEDNIGGAAFDEYLRRSVSSLQDGEEKGDPHTRSILDARVVLDEPHQLRVDNLTQLDRLPVAPTEFGVAAFCGRVAEQILQCLLGERGLA